MDFPAIKEIRIVEVLAKRGISLRYNGEWGSAVCPLPSHKPGDKDRTFNVNVRENWYKCWSQSCNEKAGSRGGDVVNLVAALDGISQYDAAKKLAELFHINEKAALHIVERPETKSNIKRTEQTITSPEIVSKGFMRETGIWLDEILTPLIPEEILRKELRKVLLNKIHESHLAGKALWS